MVRDIGHSGRLSFDVKKSNAGPGGDPKAVTTRISGYIQVELQAWPQFDVTLCFSSWSLM